MGMPLTAAAPAKAVLAAVSGAADKVWQDAMQSTVNKAKTDLRRRKSFKPTVEPGAEDRLALLEERQRQSREERVNEFRGRGSSAPKNKPHNGTRRVDTFFSNEHDDISVFYSDQEEDMSMSTMDL
jgi:hypothetical protein